MKRPAPRLPGAEPLGTYPRLHGKASQSSRAAPSPAGARGPATASSSKNGRAWARGSVCPSQCGHKLLPSKTADPASRRGAGTGSPLETRCLERRLLGSSRACASPLRVGLDLRRGWESGKMKGCSRPCPFPALRHTFCQSPP